MYATITLGVWTRQDLAKKLWKSLARVIYTYTHEKICGNNFMVGNFMIF